MKNSKKIALSGVICALALVVMLVSYIPASTYLVPAVSGAIIMILFIEISPAYAVGGFVASAFLSLWLCEKEAAVLFALFFGYYPILKAYIEKIKLKSLAYLVKYIVFNVSMIVAYILIVFIFKIPMDESGILGKYFVYALLAAGNVAFFIYDLALTRISMLYMVKWHNKIGKIIR